MALWIGEASEVTLLPIFWGTCQYHGDIHDQTQFDVCSMIMGKEGTEQHATSTGLKPLLKPSLVSPSWLSSILLSPSSSASSSSEVGELTNHTIDDTLGDQLTVFHVTIRDDRTRDDGPKSLRYEGWRPSEIVMCPLVPHAFHSCIPPVHFRNGMQLLLESYDTVFVALDRHLSPGILSGLYTRRRCQTAWETEEHAKSMWCSKRNVVRRHEQIRNHA
ncbi:uncharacterized protein BT62DRAFT_1081686 [Guyanagaster necrorhizus]|uniref:Uncharacterized protein n=1 Tax=Guyanagaster necrorhizus TaxID=856835 RepID=A0A9P7VF53_9AGAR|nr:uncharacterized protein BT62DRAFT_1081686 [Guyanagaster necrorhizus MCA 3950]KAG7439260.1 hypothetical protein BT62DRAFT_1081686 [Guyanagaster necrorhizus MCA 3950]